MIKVSSVTEAWQLVYEIEKKTDFYTDDEASARAGYPIWRSASEHLCYVCDLDNHFEVNDNAHSFNIWIETEEEERERIYPASIRAKAAENENNLKFYHDKYLENLSREIVFSDMVKKISDIAQKYIKRNSDDVNSEEFLDAVTVKGIAEYLMQE